MGHCVEVRAKPNLQRAILRTALAEIFSNSECNDPNHASMLLHTRLIVSTAFKKNILDAPLTQAMLVAPRSAARMSGVAATHLRITEHLG